MGKGKFSKETTWKYHFCPFEQAHQEADPASGTETPRGNACRMVEAVQITKVCSWKTLPPSQASITSFFGESHGEAGDHLHPPEEGRESKESGSYLSGQESHRMDRTNEDSASAVSDHQGSAWV